MWRESKLNYTSQKLKNISQTKSRLDLGKNRVQDTCRIPVRVHLGVGQDLGEPKVRAREGMSR